MNINGSVYELSRFYDKIEKTPQGCWIWTASTRPNGYGQFMIYRDGIRKTVSAHRYALEIFGDDFDPDLDVSSTCKNKLCVNPDHLIQTTRRETVLNGEGNAAKNAIKTHCKNGHELTEENIYRSSDGRKRKCKICALAYRREYYQKTKVGKNEQKQTNQKINSERNHRRKGFNNQISSRI